MGRCTHRPAVRGADAEVMLDIAIVMRHPAMRSSLWAVAQREAGLRPVGAASRLEEAVRLLMGARPDVVVVDEDFEERRARLRAAAPGAVGGRPRPGVAGAAPARGPPPAPPPPAPGATFLSVGTDDHPAYEAIRAATTSSSVRATAA